MRHTAGCARTAAGAARSRTGGRIRSRRRSAALWCSCPASAAQAAVAARQGRAGPGTAPSPLEVDNLPANLSALLTPRVAVGVRAHFLPVAAGKSPETFRSHTLKLGEQLRDAAAVRPAA